MPALNSPSFALLGRCSANFRLCAVAARSASSLPGPLAKSRRLTGGVQLWQRPLGQRPRLHVRCLSTGSPLPGGDPCNPEIDPEEEKFMVRSPYSSVEIPEVNLAQFVFRDVEKFKDKVALVSKAD